MAASRAPAASSAPVWTSAPPATGSCCASSWIRTGSSPPTPCATSTSASSRAPAGAWRWTTAARWRSSWSTRACRRSRCSRWVTRRASRAILRDVIRPRAAYLAGAPDAAGRRRAGVQGRARAADGPDVGRPGHVPAARRWPPTRLVPSDIGELNRLYDLGLTSWLPVGVGRPRRLLRHPRQRPPRGRRRHPRHQPGRCAWRPWAT